MPPSIVDYDFEGTLTDASGGSTLTVMGACPGANPDDPCNSSTSFGSVDGDGYWTWTSTGFRGGGFTVETTDSLNAEYTVALKFSMNNVASYRKIIDYKNLTNDNGFYFYSGAIYFYPTGATSTQTYPANTVMDLVVVRDTAGQFTVYGVGTDRNLTQLFTFDDSSNQHALPEVSGSGNLLGFFFDDPDTGSSEAASSGRVYRLKMWDEALTPEQITGDVLSPAPETGACPGQRGWDVIQDQTSRLYLAVLGRNADNEGLTYWTRARLQGMTAAALAGHLLGSAEHQLTSPTRTDAEFVDHIYQEILGRSADSGGRDYWVGRLGTDLTRGAVVLAFSDSAENVARTSTLSPMTDNEALVCRLYRTLFHRSPDDGGFSHWDGLLDGGAEPGEVARMMLAATSEGTAIADKNASDFVDHVYQGALGRSADSVGAAYWTSMVAERGRPAVAVVLANQLESVSS